MSPACCTQRTQQQENWKKLKNQKCKKIPEWRSKASEKLQVAFASCQKRNFPNQQSNFFAKPHSLKLKPDREAIQTCQKLAASLYLSEKHVIL